MYKNDDTAYLAAKKEYEIAVEEYRAAVASGLPEAIEDSTWNVVSAKETMIQAGLNSSYWKEVIEL